jgi:ssDNA-binding Zn-finger/Zn-ribbon topoisomerase 1
MYCPKCGTELPDNAEYCMKCGTHIGEAKVRKAIDDTKPVLAPSGAVSLNCPSCGAPLSPKFGEMVITCEYCGTAIALGSEGWTGIKKQTMLPVNFPDTETVSKKIAQSMDQGLLHRHLQEKSVLEELNLSLVPYWIVSVSARTSIISSDVAVEAGQIATTAALFGLMGAGIGGGRGRANISGPLVAGAMMGSMMNPGRGGAKKTFEIDNNYNFPVVALKGMAEHQPRDYQFRLEERAFFDISKLPKGIKILNGDVGEEAAKYQARTLVTQLQSDKAHAEHHMIQELHTDVDVSETELLHAPIWFARYDFKGKKIALVIDGNSGAVINSIGL